MTVSVTVKARATGAKVQVDGGEEVQIEANQERRFNLEGGGTINVTEGGATEQPIPGQAENDALIREVPADRIAQASGQAPSPRTTSANTAGAQDPALTK